MRAAGKIIHEIFKELESVIKPGISTKDIDILVEKRIREKKAKASFKNYATSPGQSGFPGSSCISVNDEVIHGIPKRNRKVREGDIVSVDLGVFLNGYHADAARTFAAGKISANARKLIDVTRESFFAGIQYAKEGFRVGDISGAIQDFVEAQRFSVVKDFVGHGIGRSLHESPSIPNFRERGRGVRLKSGMTLAIEPMVNAGRAGVLLCEDDWTVITEDGKWSAHYENTVLITDGEPELLTLF